MVKNTGNSWGEEGHQRPPGTDVPEGWDGGMDILWNYTFAFQRSIDSSYSESESDENKRALDYFGLRVRCK